MKTRAQRLKEETEETTQPNTSPAVRKTKKEILEEKNKRKDPAATGKGEGKKKLKEEPAPH